MKFDVDMTVGALFDALHMVPACHQHIIFFTYLTNTCISDTAPREPRGVSHCQLDRRLLCTFNIVSNPLHLYDPASILDSKAYRPELKAMSMHDSPIEHLQVTQGSTKPTKLLNFPDVIDEYFFVCLHQEADIFLL